MFNKQNKIDELSKQKRELVLKRDKLQRDMRNRNSKRETKIAVLENASQTDFENTNKKVVRAIDSEQIYVTQVAEAEKREYLEEKRNESSKEMQR